MTAYQQFINNPNIQKGKIARIWELEVNQKIDDLIDFSREFLKLKGFEYTGYNKDFKSTFNNNFMFDGAIQEETKIAIRIKQI